MIFNIIHQHSRGPGGNIENLGRCLWFSTPRETPRMRINHGKTMFDRYYCINSTNHCENGENIGALYILTSSYIEPRSEKTGLRGFRPGPTQTGLCSHRRWLEP